MKKYKIEFTTDYSAYADIVDSGRDFNGYYLEQVQIFPDEVKLCKKWKGKSISILQLEKYISEFGEVVFNGETIEIYNGYRE